MCVFYVQSATSLKTGLIVGFGGDYLSDSRSKADNPY